MRSLTLHGHQMDVLDIDWSASGLLASASIDNNILIWDIPSALKSSLRVLAPLKQLHRHTSFVKGVQFDPFGIFLASASADNTIIIWNCETWKAEHILEDPLRDSADRSIFRRLSWAPDGGSLCVTCATKGGKPVGMVLKRDTWASVADLVGHNAPTTCCRFNPHPMKISAADDGSDESLFTACTVALGDQQGVISVWTTTQNSPLFVINNIFDGPVLDLSWFARTDSTILLAACSLDGSVIFLNLSGPNAIGGERCLSSEEKDLHLKRIYGRGDKELSNSSPILPEDPAIIRFARREQIELQNLPQRKESNLSVASSPPPRFQQTVTRLKNGKKRIQPMLSESELNFSEVSNFQNLPITTNSLSTSIPSPPRALRCHPFSCSLTQRQPLLSLQREGQSASCVVKMRTNSSLPINRGLSSLQKRPYSTQLSLTASDLSPPRPVDPVMSIITLSTLQDQSRLMPNNWETYIVGKVTAISGIEVSPKFSPKNPKGVVIIGTTLGSLLILCLSSGIKLYSPLILGGSVIGIDVVFVADTQMLNIFVLNSEGDIWLFQYLPQSQLRGPKESQLKLIYKTSLHPIRSFLGDHSLTMHLESADLTDSGELVVSVKSSNSNESDWQLHFQYLNELQCWRQITHLKSFLSLSDLTFFLFSHYLGTVLKNLKT
jgi:hypothetical protein